MCCPAAVSLPDSRRSADIVSAYADLATRVEPGACPGICGDPSDDLFIATALVAQADVVVSGDRHLLDCAERSPIPVVTVAQLLAILSDPSISESL